jgi:hypothetical protein
MGRVRKVGVSEVVEVKRLVVAVVVAVPVKKKEVGPHCHTHNILQAPEVPSFFKAEALLPMGIPAPGTLCGEEKSIVVISKGVKKYIPKALISKLTSELIQVTLMKSNDSYCTRLSYYRICMV